MFYKERIEELEFKVRELTGKILDMKQGLKAQTHIYPKSPPYVCDIKVPISNILEMLLNVLGYEIAYDYKPERESYTIKKIPKTQKKTKKKKK